MVAYLSDFYRKVTKKSAHTQVFAWIYADSFYAVFLRGLFQCPHNIQQTFLIIKTITITKRFKFFILAAVALFALCTLTPFLASCSEDAIEEQEQTLTKADILRTKAKEFAKKYNVDMTLNQENIDSLAEVLTVEQMERDFQEFSLHLKDFNPTIIKEKHAIKSRRLSIHRTVGLTEYINTRLTGTLRGTGGYLNGTQYSLSSATVKYECGGQGNDIANIEISVSKYEVNARIPAHITVCGKEIEYLYAAGTVTAYSQKYRYSASITIDYSKNSGLHSYLNI